jgi:hypothetical protein
MVLLEHLVLMEMMELIQVDGHIPVLELQEQPPLVNFLLIPLVVLLCLL